MEDRVAPLRPLSASQHSGVDKVLRDSFFFELEKISEAEAFVSNDSIDEIFVSTVMTSLKNATNESQLQQGLFNAMSILPTITVPAESKRPPKEKETNFFQKLRNIVNPAPYKEMNMRSLLDLYAKEHLSSFVRDVTLQKMNDVQPGLFVRAASRPDLSVIVKGAASGDDGDIATGEVKNDDNYSVKDAMMQNGAYLMLVLYWWRVVVGREVSSVHGFTLCGPLCRDLKHRKRNWLGRPKNDSQYSVCLMRLSAPEYLGGIPRLTYFKGTSSLNDTSMVRILCQFLMNGQLWGQKTTKVIEKPCPAFFTAPVNFVSELSSTNSSANWELQFNGTAALVFRCHGKEGVSEVIEMANDKARRHFSYLWIDFLENQEGEDVTKKPVFYVKTVTGATDRSLVHVLGDLQASARSLKDEDFLLTYPVRSIKLANCYFVLMADRGTRINTSMTWECGELNRMFRDLWEKATGLSEDAELQHGDIAKHNILFESKNKNNNGDRLVLIDWDEARAYPKSRVSQGNEYLHLQHPEGLRRTPLLYTKVQLALLYWDLIGNHVRNDVDWRKDPKTCPVLEEYAKSVRDDDEEESIAKNANSFVSKTEAEFQL